MKKHLIFGLRLSFYISILLFFDSNVLIIPAILLINYLFLENKYYSPLPLILVFFIPVEYKLLLILAYLIHLIFYSYVKRNRIYSIIVFLLCVAITNLVLLMMNTYDKDILCISLLSIIFVRLINAFFIFYQKGKSSYSISTNDTLIHLIFLLAYMLLITIYNPISYAYYMLFIQLFFINKIAYSFILFIVGISSWYLIYKELNTSFISYLSSSYIPIVFLFDLDYTKLETIFFSLYTVLSLLTFFTKNDNNIENKYVENLFKSFNYYLNEINNEYTRLTTLKELKQNHLEGIQSAYCKYCISDCDCRTKLDKRYVFLSNAINHNDSNIYDCPHYTEFYLNTNIDTRSKIIPHNALTELSYEIEYLYNQGLKRKFEYQRLINDLSFYGYEILDLNIYLNDKTIYFNVNIANKKKIIPELILKLTNNLFKEELDIKIIDNKDYQEVYIYKKPRVKLEYSHQILAKDNNGISGDNYFIKRNHNDSYIFALSDGMGNGHNAYLESAQTLDLLKRLLSYNFSLKTTLRLLENIYEIKCEYDSYATLDVLAINTSNMKLNLYKLGSTSTYIIHNYEIRIYENKSLPYKLDEINSSYEIEYFKGDTIILASDGISDFITMRDLKSIDYNKSSSEILNDITNILKQKENNELKDDASLIVIKVI